MNRTIVGSRKDLKPESSGQTAPSYGVIALFMLNLAMSTTLFAGEFQVMKRTVRADAEGKLSHQVAVAESWNAERTAVILCDVWDYHHSINAVRRLEEMLPRMNDLLKEARGRGATIIHAPSDCMPAYEQNPARLRAVSAPQVDLPKDIASWCSRIPSEVSSLTAQYPVDQSDGGEDDDPEEHRQWAAKLEALGRNPGMPWKAQSPGIEIDTEKDYISDRGDEVWRILKDRKIEHVILLGVHTNMCVLGRPFGLRQIAAQKLDVVLVRDLTDCMYNPKRRPFVDHFTGNELVVSYVERFVCPSITSDQILGGEPLRFAGDKRRFRDAISSTGSEPSEWQIQRVGKSPLLFALGNTTATLRCAIRFPIGTLDEPASLAVQQQVTGAWLNGKPLELRSSDDRGKEYRITKDLTFGNDDANLLVLQIDFSRLANNLVRPPSIKAMSYSLELDGNWEVKAGADEVSRNIPLPAKFGMSPDVFYSLP
jgi:nicotinamidase-related amidase